MSGNKKITGNKRKAAGPSLEFVSLKMPEENNIPSDWNKETFNFFVGLKVHKYLSQSKYNTKNKFVLTFS